MRRRLMDNRLDVNKEFRESDFSPTECRKCGGNGYKAYWASGEDCPSCGGSGRKMEEGQRHVMATHMDKHERNNGEALKWLFGDNW
jgi:DnaJ-class molecular chaperone